MQSFPGDVVLCHDGSPAANFNCGVCGYLFHVHKGWLPKDYSKYDIHVFCPKCNTEVALKLPNKWIGE